MKKKTQRQSRVLIEAIYWTFLLSSTTLCLETRGGAPAPLVPSRVAKSRVSAIVEMLSVWLCSGRASIIHPLDESRGLTIGDLWNPVQCFNPHPDRVFPDPARRWRGAGVPPPSLLSAKLIEQFSIRKKAFDSSGFKLSEYVTKFYLNVTDGVTGRVKGQIFEYLISRLAGQSSRIKLKFGCWNDLDRVWETSKCLPKLFLNLRVSGKDHPRTRGQKDQI